MNKENAVIIFESLASALDCVIATTASAPGISFFERDLDELKQLTISCQPAGDAGLT